MWNASQSKIRLACMLSLCAAMPARAAPDAGTPQTAFITGVYKAYLGKSTSKGRGAPDPARFYSASLRSLLAANKKLCETRSRGDDICGYGADGDTLLDAQDSADNLTFANARFKAAMHGPNAVDVSFNVMARKDPASERRLRYLLVPEDGGWRVDDAISLQGADVKAPATSMRKLLADENALIAANARDVADAMSWVSIYVEGQQPDRFERFIAFPLQVCKGTACQTYQKGDKRLGQLVQDLHAIYFKGDARLQMIEAGKQDSAKAKPGSVIVSGPFSFRLTENAWWLAKVDLAPPPASKH